MLDFGNHDSVICGQFRKKGEVTMAESTTGDMPPQWVDTSGSEPPIDPWSKTVQWGRFKPNISAYLSRKKDTGSYALRKLVKFLL